MILVFYVSRNYEALGLAIDINNIDPRMQAPEEVTDVPAVKASGLMADGIFLFIQSNLECFVLCSLIYFSRCLFVQPSPQ
jgi:hypothetical protein